MKPISAGLDSFLAAWTPSSNVYMADLYTFTLATGEVLRLSGAETAIDCAAWAPGSVNSGGCAFALGPKFARTKTKTDIGVEVSELDIEIYAGAADLIGTLTWQQAIRMGIFDGATLELDRAFMAPYGNVQGTTILFYGHTGEISCGRTKIEMKAVDMKDLLNIQMPRRLYQAACNHVFGDAMCGFNRSSLGATFACIAGTVQSAVAGPIAPSPSTLFDQGTITGLTGANAGYTRQSTNVISGTVYMLKPWLFPVAIGDEFTLLPGCDHTVATCQGVFNNLANFGGFPYIPPPEDAV